MITKEKLIETIKLMPEETFEDIDVLWERIILLEKIESGIKNIEDGNVISDEEMKSVIQSWFKKEIKEGLEEANSGELTD